MFRLVRFDESVPRGPACLPCLDRNGLPDSCSKVGLRRRCGSSKVGEGVLPESPFDVGAREMERISTPEEFWRLRTRFCTASADSFCACARNEIFLRGRDSVFV